MPRKTDFRNTETKLGSEMRHILMPDLLEEKANAFATSHRLKETADAIADEIDEDDYWDNVPV